MPLPTAITDLSQTAASNYPSGTDSPAVLDDVQRAHASFIALLRDGKGRAAEVSVASAATVDIGSLNSEFVNVTGTTTITSFGTNYTGLRILSFAGAVTLTYNATTMQIAGGASYTTAAGDIAIAVPYASGWRVQVIPKVTLATLGAAASGANSDINALNALASVPTVVSNSWGPGTRQTVRNGPVDNSGLPAFGGATGSTTLTASGTLYVSAANGILDRNGSITNPSWTGLSTNGTMYLYLDIAADGSCTTGSTTLAPTYRFGGADVTTNNQFTFNTQEMVGKVGNGSTATQTYRVFVGEVTVAGGVVSAIVWYALMGRYDSGLFSAAVSTTYSKNHNIGSVLFSLDITIADDSTGTNERPVTNFYNTALAAARGIYAGASTRNAAAISTASSSIGMNTSGGDMATAYFRIRARRAF